MTDYAHLSTIEGLYMPTVTRWFRVNYDTVSDQIYSLSMYVDQFKRSSSPSTTATHQSQVFSPKKREWGPIRVNYHHRRSLTYVLTPRQLCLPSSRCLQHSSVTERGSRIHHEALPSRSTTCWATLPVRPDHNKQPREKT